MSKSDNPILIDKTISVIGSTGSIGKQSLDVARSCGFSVSALAANNNIELLEKQIREFKPLIAAVCNEKAAVELKQRVHDCPTKIVANIDGLIEAACEKSSDLVITSMVGMIGIKPTVEAIKAKKNIGLANKETLVCAGEIITDLAKKNNVKILPVDSEHSAIFQCLEGCNEHKEINKIILTASGGPFFGKKREELENVTPEIALKHPNWNMGAKISIDSATLINKGLEFIEAYWLFNVKPSQIDIIIQRESIIHSMVEYIDGSIIAQLGVPDMRIPIQYAITYPKRIKSTTDKLDFEQIKNLSFYKPDYDTFIGLKACMKAIEIGGTMPAAVNAANEEAVKLFLEKKIKFTDIFDIAQNIIFTHITKNNPQLNDIFTTENETRAYVRDFFKI